MCRIQCALALVALCVGLAHSWDIAVSQGDKLIFYTDGIKTDTVYFTSQNLTALAYDEVHNTILYVDKQKDYDAICGYYLSSKEKLCFIQRYRSNIHSLTFDPVTELLFFTDTNEGSINWVSLKSGDRHNVYGNLLIRMYDRMPQNIAVDSCRGYIYWTNTNIPNKHILERARLDGSEREYLNRYDYSCSKHVLLLGLVIDPKSRHMYYSEDICSTYYLNRADLSSHHEKYIPGNPSVAKGLTASKNHLYWIDRRATYQTVWSLQKNALDVEPKQISRFDDGRSLSIVSNYKVKEHIQGLQDCVKLSSLLPTTTETYNTHNIKQTTETEFIVETEQTTTEDWRVSNDWITHTEQTPGVEQTTEIELIVETEQTITEDWRVSDDWITHTEQTPGVVQTTETKLIVETEQTTTEEWTTHTEQTPGVDQTTEGEHRTEMRTPGYINGRCDVSVCENYCLQGNCKLNDDGLPKCRCNAGYSGHRCEFYVCHNYCLNNGDCSLNSDDKPVCKCVGNHDGLRCEAVQIATTTQHSAKGNFTLADLLSRWRKPAAKISVIVEV